MRLFRPFLNKIYDQWILWITVVGWPWLPARPPPSCFLIPYPQQNKGRKQKGKGSGSRYRQGDNINYCQRQNSWFEEEIFNLLPNKIELDCEKQRQKIKHLPLTLPFYPGLTSLLHSWLLLYLTLAWAARGCWGMGCCGQSAACQLCNFFLLTHFLCSNMSSFMKCPPALVWQLPWFAAWISVLM